MRQYPEGSLNKLIPFMPLDYAQESPVEGLYQKFPASLEHKHPLKGQKQQGFTIVMAIFILVVLGLLGGYMVRLSGVQHATSIHALQGARAYQAAGAGLGWAIAKISISGGCVDVNAQTALTLPGLPGFTVNLTCTLASYKEGSDIPGIYRINAHSEFGAYGGVDYVSRELEVSIVR